MNETKRYNVSSGPHIRDRLTTGQAMYDVILALVPAAFFGVWLFGFRALLVLLMSITASVTGEWVFDYITGKENTLSDGSAVLTGLLLGLCLPATAPLYVPYLGGVFAVVVVKGLFGGLGKNFMNPALGGRIFLLLSFGSAMTQYAVDGVTGATPLASLAAGDTVSLMQVWTGHAGGVIGCSTLALLFGGLYLWAVDGITWQIPVSLVGSFALFMGIFGGGFDPALLLTHIGSGGVIMAAFFMATDPVTSPVTGAGQLVYGALVGILSGLFRVYGSSTDSVSYAIVLGNLATPVIDACLVPRPFAYRTQEGRNRFAHPAALACLAAAVCAVLLMGVRSATSGIIETRELSVQMDAARAAIGSEVEALSYDDAAQAALAELDGAVYGTEFGNVVINSYTSAADASGNVLGALVSVTNQDGRDAPITLYAGILADGTVGGIVYTDLNETPGIGMKVENGEFTDQFRGLNGLELGGNVEAVSGATISSRAVINAVNAALSFSAAVREGAGQ